MALDKIPVISIVGAGRSGSTLLERLLAENGEVLSVGEMMYVWDRGVLSNELCSCGSAFQSCPFWAEVMGLAVGSIDVQRDVAHEVNGLMARTCRTRHVFGMAVDRQRLGAQRARRQLQKLLAPVYREALNVSGKRVIVDASKEPQYPLALTGDAFDITPIHLVRDGRAVAYSWRRRRLRPEIHWDTREMPRRNSVRASLEWNRAIVLAEVFQYCVDTHHRVHYEVLVSDPDAVLSQVCAWSGLRSAVSGSPVRSADVMWHTVSGNPSRFHSPKAVTPDTEWMDRYRGPARIATDVLTLPGRLRYGYR